MSELIKFGPKDLIKYPFLKDSKQYLTGFTVEKIGKDEELKPIFVKAFKRIEASLYGMKYKEDDEPLLEILSFFVALVMLRITNVSYFCKRFALAEAIKSEKHMEADLVRTPAIINGIIRDIFGVKMINDGNNYKILVADYLKHSVTFNDLPWKLINRRVEGGYVYLTRHESVRLLRNELQQKIYRSIMNAPRVVNYPMFKPYVLKLHAKAEEFHVAPPNMDTDVPPCVKDAIAVMDAGENLSHAGRFLIATFYMTREADIGDVIQFFKKAPDWNPRVTTYQLKKIKEGGYKCPGCDKVDTQGLCRRTADCGTIKNPLSFRKWKK